MQAGDTTTAGNCVRRSCVHYLSQRGHPLPHDLLVVGGGRKAQRLHGHQSREQALDVQHERLVVGALAVCDLERLGVDEQLGQGAHTARRQRKYTTAAHSHADEQIHPRTPAHITADTDVDLDSYTPAHTALHTSISTVMTLFRTSRKDRCPISVGGDFFCHSRYSSPYFLLNAV